ncbi:hypothetical protein M406DRAFT_73241 [Cryphonectria parasitica EP155]|uniref:Carboxypeptidase n=1 Tax=Cryphonectria parasitica (strain ATCC 38755 / EP155) TaxID=660469 RepID=A0A9P4XU30_CRYP1|nr:uncharacterized protein M406DRAFT_73241 [Cryphonectria parasitica EP155]KAF3760780.1 hypothetical protein M406DRAFT_73241 [Cryphonectria parasitica EP155]
MRWSHLLCPLALAGAACARRSTRHVSAFDKRRAEAGRSVPEVDLPKKRQEHHGYKRDNTTEYQFLTNTTSKFLVDGTAIPDVDFDVGESYAGSIPVTTDADGNYLFYWFFPSTNAAAEKEILIWLNGGPGCSSLEGLLQENGPFLWQYGTYKPVENPWSWHHLTHVVWVEQPIGTGFSQGTVTAENEEDVAAQFMSWFKNFVDTFGLQGYKIYIAGESYAGMFVPYIASAMLDTNDTTYYGVDGILIYDPSIAYSDLQAEYVTLPFVETWNGLFMLNDTFLADIRARDESCGYAAFRDEYLAFPPTASLPAYEDLPSINNYSCVNIYYDVFDAVLLTNPCFDIYQVATTCPLLWDVLGFPGSLEYEPEGAFIYFNRTDVQDAIHAPHIDWAECANENVFVHGDDTSLPSAVTVLPGVIDRTQNVIIGHGGLDMVLLANGTLLQLQNMTWGGQQGFSSYPTDPFYVPYNDYTDLSTLAGAGVFGSVVSERGLTFVGVDLSGHMVPQYAPTAAYRHLEVLLGRVANLSSTDAFTTDPGVPQASLVGETGNFP